MEIVKKCNYYVANTNWPKYLQVELPKQLCRPALQTSILATYIPLPLLHCDLGSIIPKVVDQAK